MTRACPVDEAEVTHAMGHGPTDLLTIGRSGVDLYPLQSRTPLEQVTSFARFLGGSATNVAVAAARLGHDAGVITRVGADPFGRYIGQALAEFGVRTEQVSVAVTGEELLTPVTFCELFPPDDFPIHFYRKPSAPDLQIRSEELDLAAVRAVRIYWSTVTGLSEEPSRSAHHTAWQARAASPAAADRWTVLDLDYRAVFWAGPAQAHQQIARALPRVDAVVGNVTECSVAVTGREEPELSAGQLAEALLERGARLVVVKLGPDGVLGATAEEQVHSAPVPVEVVNGLGAGDAFGGALCHGLLTGLDLQRSLDLANAAGAYVAGQLACADAMPTLEQLTAWSSPGGQR